MTTYKQVREAKAEHLRLEALANDASRYVGYAGHTPETLARAVAHYSKCQADSQAARKAWQEAKSAYEATRPARRRCVG